MKVKEGSKELRGGFEGEELSIFFNLEVVVFFIRVMVGVGVLGEII